MTNVRVEAKAGNVDSHERASSSLPSSSLPSSSPVAAPSHRSSAAPALVICRNKHWRYISSYHGPWLNLPPEVLESLAYSNFYSPHPQPIDPAVLFDLVKIRRLVDDATSLAVRAANGTTSAALSNSLNASNGMLNGADVEILGLGSSRGGGVGGCSNAKLSRERKHRMREHATRKLAAAYRLDEIAASVATMQSASALEDVAKLVLQRQQTDADAQYVHFFHEKIPSRALAASTTLDALTSIIHQRPTDPATYRTRAITRLFKHDFGSAARDLTDGLAVLKVYHHGGHSNEQRDLVLAHEAAKVAPDRSRPEARVDDKDQPSSLESQFLFHRGNAYLTLACEHISAALQGQAGVANGIGNDPAPADCSLTPQKEPPGGRARAEARKMLRTCAKRALRDYLAFLSRLEYTPGLSTEHTEAFLQNLCTLQHNQDRRSRSRSWSERLLNLDTHSQSGLAEALAKYKSNANGRPEAQQPPPPPPPPQQQQQQQQQPRPRPRPHIPKPKIYKLNTLFAAVPPADLPPYPYSCPYPRETDIKQDCSASDAAASDAAAFGAGADDDNDENNEPGANHEDDADNSFNLTDFSEAVTYHPLLTEVMHSVLLCHCLIQTSAKELRRHAYMAARVARVCDGYPIFLAARSPARVDWMAILRGSNNFLDMEAGWEKLCRPSPRSGPLSSSSPSPASQKTKTTKTRASASASASAGAAVASLERAKEDILQGESKRKERIKQQAIEDALADERVIDEETFKQNIRAREDALTNGTSPSNPSSGTATAAAPTTADATHTQANGKEQKPCPNATLSTDRAEAIVRWIRHAPLPGSSSTSSRKGAPRKKKTPVAVAVSSPVTTTPAAPAAPAAPATPATTKPNNGKKAPNLDHNDHDNSDHDNSDHDNSDHDNNIINND